LGGVSGADYIEEGSLPVAGRPRFAPFLRQDKRDDKPF
jgi:hypothetical protein